MMVSPASPRAVENVNVNVHHCDGDDHNIDDSLDNAHQPSNKPKSCQSFGSNNSSSTSSGDGSSPSSFSASSSSSTTNSECSSTMTGESSESETSSSATEEDLNVSNNKKKNKKKITTSSTTKATTETRTKTKKKPRTCLSTGKCIKSCVAYGKICPLLSDAAGRAVTYRLGCLREDSELFRDCCMISSQQKKPRNLHNDNSSNNNGKAATKATTTNKKKKTNTNTSSIQSNDNHHYHEDDQTESSGSSGGWSSSSSIHRNGGGDGYDSKNNSLKKEEILTVRNDELQNEFSCFPAVNIVHPSDIVMGEKLGEGGFCNVYSCALKTRKGTKTLRAGNRDDDEDDNEFQQQSSSSIITDESCAVKFLRREITTNRKNYQHGAADLATEAFFLARLGDDGGRQHPNIVQLKAVAAGSVEDNVKNMSNAACHGPRCDEDFVPVPEGFFIVIERLVETLEQRINRWQSQIEADQNSHSHGIFYRMSKEYKDKQRTWLKERVEVATEIAKVMAYLSSRNVAFRDLKPDNVGIDRHGKLKLFDLGLCKEQKPSLAYSDDEDDDDSRNAKKTKARAYRMTGHTGSRRYMAPEVALDQGYDKSVDVYSFGVLLWEICSLEKPFKGFGSKKHFTNVIQGGERPKMDHHHTSFWPVNLQWLMKSCWSSKPDDRPSFDVVHSTLLEVQDELSQSQPNRTRSRSTGSHEEAGCTNTKNVHLKSSTLSPVFEAIKKPARQGGLRVRSLGFKRGDS